MTQNANDFDVLTFDCYGTLIDWEGGILTGLRPLSDRSRVTRTDDDILRTHAHYESRQQRTTPGKPYPDLLACVYRRVAEEWQVSVSLDECTTYGAKAQDWEPFPDTVSSLGLLKKRFELVILSNVDNRTFAHANAKLGVEFNSVYTAEDIGSYKPSLRNFEYMLCNLSRRGIEKDRILHVAESLFHDHEPATKLDLHNCWIHRRSNKDGFGATAVPENMPPVKFKFDSLREFADWTESNE